METKSERGQAMILVAIAMVALLAMVGLALDGGKLHSNRRQMQNASDAAALAGAQVLLDGACKGGAADGDVVTAIVAYTLQNGVAVDTTQPAKNINAWYVNASEQRLAVVGSGSIPSGTRGVEVTVMFTETTSFMKIVGQSEMSAAGNAVAMIGPVTQISGGSNVIPIAVPDDIVYGMAPGTKFTVDNDVYCKTNGEQCIGDPGDANSQRGWLNFDYIYNVEHYQSTDPLRRTHTATTNAAAIEAYISGAKQTPPIFLGTAPSPLPPAVPTTVYIDGDYIHGEPGEKASDAKALFDYYAGQTVIVPVFDVVYSPEYMDDHDEWFPDPAVDSGKTWPNQNQYLYHIVGFASVDVCDPATDGSCNSNNEQKEIVATLKLFNYGQVQINPTKAVLCGSAMLNGVALWR